MAADDSLSPQAGPAGGANGQPALALLFAPGRRPTAADLTPWTAPGESPAADEHPNRLEIFGSGQRFRVLGLSPGPMADTPSVRHAYGFSGDPALAGAEPVVLNPAFRIGRGDGLIPVVRAQVDLACQMLRLPGMVGVSWAPAETVMAPGHFRQLITAWLDGGAFPGLGLTGLAVSADAAVSTGLALFTGFEVMVRSGGSAADSAKLALRAIHLLIESGASGYDAVVALADGEFRCTFSADRRTLQIERVRDGAG